MKTICTYIAIVLAGVLQAAYVPTEWQVRVGPKATVFQAERYHGDGLALRATLTDGGLPLPYQGTARLYAQTNGMGAAWWNLADATVSSNVLTATWLPEYDTGADVVDVFLGAPGNYQAHARIRFLPSPGATPGILPLPTPVLNFADVQVLNPPYYTQAETDARILELSPAAQPPGNYLAVSNAAMSAASQSDLTSATNALAMSTSSALGSYLPLSGGMLSGDLAFSGSGAIAYTGVWGVRLYANAGTAGNRIYTNDGYSWQSERGLAWFDETTNHVHAAAVAATNYTDFVIGQFDPPIPVFDVYAEDVTNVSLAVTSSAISTNNQAFVTAVRNVPIAGADATDLAEIAEYGGYGTVGAAILALIAGLAALKRGKADKDDLRYAKKTLRSADMVVSLKASLFPISATNGSTSLSLYADDVSLRIVRDGETGEVTGAAVYTSINGVDTLLITVDDYGEHYAAGWSVTFAQSPILSDFTFAYLLADRTVMLLDSLDNGEHEIDVGDGDKTVYVRPPASADGSVRDFLLDVKATNSSTSAARSLSFEFDGLCDDYLISVPDGDDPADLTEIAVAKAASASAPTIAYVRLYFTETSFVDESLPVFAIRREDVSTPTTVQGGVT